MESGNRFFPNDIPLNATYQILLLRTNNSSFPNISAANHQPHRRKATRVLPPRLDDDQPPTFPTMSSRFSAARPKRAGESFARTHHADSADGGGQPSSSKKVKFDVRNPSALAPDREDDDEDDDAVLEADVIGKGAGGTKRGAVNIDGYDSDSDNETFKDRAAARKSQGKGKGNAGAGGYNDQDVADVDIDIADQLDNYDKNLRNGAQGDKADDDEDEDMFAEEDPDEDDNNDPAAPKTTTRASKDKEVRFLDADKIEGQEQASKSGGVVKLFEENSESSDDEEDLELAIQEEGVDEEVGMGGLKKNAPKIDAFNMKNEQQEGAFDEAGNFIRKAVDPDAVHDRWLEGVSKKEMKRAAEAHEKREAERRRQRKEDDSVATEDLLKRLILSLDKGETPIEGLARLGKGRAKEKKVPKWKLKKQEKKNGDGETMDIDHAKEAEDPAQVKIKEGINAITEAADKLLGREFTDIYETEREMLIRDWQTEAGERWLEPAVAEENPSAKTAAASSDKMWEYRWIDGREGGNIQGPYDGPTMRAWQDAGYFDGVEFRAVGEDSWDRVATFT